MQDTVINGKKLVAQVGKYASYRKQIEKDRATFHDQLAEKKEPQKSEHKPLQRPCFGKSKPISTEQAKRLAEYAPLIQESAAKHHVPVELICGVILQESGGNAKARSHCGAKGLMQLMPATARSLGVKNAYDPVQNIDGGTKYLRKLLDRFDGDVHLALAGYNAGEGAVVKHGNKIPPYKETQHYVPSVLGYTQSMVEILLASEQLPSMLRRV